MRYDGVCTEKGPKYFTLSGPYHKSFPMVYLGDPRETTSLRGLELETLLWPRNGVGLKTLLELANVDAIFSLLCLSFLHLLPRPTASTTLSCFPAKSFSSFPTTGALPVKKIREVRADWSGKSWKLKSKGLESEVAEDVDLEDEDEEGEEGFSSRRRGGYRGKEKERDYDKDPEFGEILGDCLDNPEKAQKKMEERLRKKRNKILHMKTGSGTPMTVTFNKFNFSNSYIWFEFYNTPLEKDVNLICDTIRSWHILGRLGGYNSMNMQLSQAPLDKRPDYDAIQGANVEPTTFYNIGDLEVQDNLARIWVDIGTSEPLVLDVLINALNQISSDYIGIKQLAFGGSEFENWKENMTSEEAGFRVQKI